MKNNFDVAAETKILRDSLLRAVNQDFDRREAAGMTSTEGVPREEIHDLIKAGSRLFAGALMDLQSIASSLRTIAHNTGLPVVQLAKLEPPPSTPEPDATDAAKGLSE